MSVCYCCPILRGSGGCDICSQFEWSLLPHLLPFDGINHNGVVVMDNASIHYNARVERLILSVGELLVHLPTYCPDLNPIEESFPAVKSFLGVHELLATKPGH